MPNGEESYIVFRNQGVGTAIIQDIRMTVDRKHFNCTEREYAVHSWAQIVVRTQEVVGTLIDTSAMNRKLREGMDKRAHATHNLETIGSLDAVRLDAWLCDMHGDDVGPIRSILTTPHVYAIEIGASLGYLFGINEQFEPIISMTHVRFIDYRE